MLLLFVVEISNVYGNWQHAHSKHTPKPFHDTYKPIFYKPQPKRYMFRVTNKPYQHKPIYKVDTYNPLPYRNFHAYVPLDTYVKPSYKQPYKSQVEYTGPSSYQFSYGVVDSYSNLNYGENEERHGDTTSGEYRVLLPDCRTQIVKYHTTDKYSGNVMEVTYEGEPCY